MRGVLCYFLRLRAAGASRANMLRGAVAVSKNP